MHINLDNYEQFFLDHREGNLSPEMEKELADFLEANPDLKIVLDDFDSSPLPTIEIRNEALKARLKKYLQPTNHISEDNVNEWMIRDVEGLLDEAEENELKEFISLNPAYRFDYKIFGYTKLSPDLSVAYRRKNDLKKKVFRLPVGRLAWLLTASAAIIFIFIGIRFLQKPESNPILPLNTTDIQVAAEIPGTYLNETETPSHKTASESPFHETPSHQTPSETSSYKKAAAFHIKPYAAKSIVFFNPSKFPEINYEVYNIPPELIAEKKDKPLIAKVFNNMIARTRHGFGNRPNLDKARKTDINIWSIAEAGINGYNSISGRELELYVRKDEEGKVTSYALVDQERLILAKELNKN